MAYRPKDDTELRCKTSNFENPLQGLSSFYVTVNKIGTADIVHDLTQPVPEHYHGFFGLVISFDTLEHIEETEQFCRNMVDSTEDGGYIYVSTVWIWPHHGEVDYFRFSPDGLLRCFKGLPIDVISCDWDGDKTYSPDGQTGVYLFGRVINKP